MNKQKGDNMKKKSIKKKNIKKNVLVGVGALTMISAATVAAYSVTSVNKKMKPYHKKYKFIGDKILFENEFETESLAVSFGGLALDFRTATLKDNLGTLKLFAHFSGVDIIVPDDWVVKTLGRIKNSGVSNQCDEENSYNQPTLIVKHDLQFAGLSIRKASLSNEIEEDFQDQTKDVLENAESFVEDLKKHT